jgi:hypothetical protein
MLAYRLRHYIGRLRSVLDHRQLYRRNVADCSVQKILATRDEVMQSSAIQGQSERAQPFSICIAFRSAIHTGRQRAQIQ